MVASVHVSAEQDHALVDFHVQREILQSTRITVAFQALHDLLSDFAVTGNGVSGLGLDRPEARERGNRDH